MVGRLGGVTSAFRGFCRAVKYEKYHHFNHLPCFIIVVPLAFLTFGWVINTSTRSPIFKANLVILKCDLF